MTQAYFLRRAALIGALAAATTLSACAPLMVGGALLGGTLMAADRRTSGVQIEDQTIELKAQNRIHDVMGDRGHISVTSYNRMALITGEVPTEENKLAVEQAVQQVQNVRSIVNELAVMGASSYTSRSNDTFLTGKVKATLIDSRQLSANAFKVVTERGTVYLMGRVTEREATRAVELTRTIGGVHKVVQLFETITEAELIEMRPRPAAK